MSTYAQNIGPKHRALFERLKIAGALNPVWTSKEGERLICDEMSIHFPPSPDVPGLDEIKDKLLKGEFSSLSIEFNQHSCNYEKASKAIPSDYYSEDAFISKADMRECIDKNSIWSAHWYPHAPVGFHVLHASTFAKLMAALAERGVE